jgi:methionyl-tRNA formyltransferase
MDVGLDTGDVICLEKIEILNNDDFETVHDKLAEASSKALLRAVRLLEDGKATYTPQGDEYTYAEKITKEDCFIDFCGTAQEVHNRIRGLSPIPLSFTHTTGGKMLKVIESVICKREGVCGKPGQVLSLDNGIEVACAEGSLTILRVLPEGKARMSAADFIRGRNIAVGDILS